jgi:hypothetical protein
MHSNKAMQSRATNKGCSFDRHGRRTSTISGKETEGFFTLSLAGFFCVVGEETNEPLAYVCDCEGRTRSIVSEKRRGNSEPHK